MGSIAIGSAQLMTWSKINNELIYFVEMQNFERTIFSLGAECITKIQLKDNVSV